MIAMDDTRALPAAVNAEKSILGSILQNNDLYPQAAEKLEAADYSLDSHKRIFTCMARMLDAGRPVDIITLSEELSKKKQLESVGGVAYLASLTEGLPRRVHIDDWVLIVRDKSMQRALALAAESMRNAAIDQSEDSASVLGQAQAELDRIALRGASSTLESIGSYFARRYPRIDDYYSRNTREPGLLTGFPRLDEMMGGFQRGETTIVAARPSVGKSALAGDIAANIAIDQRKTVAFFQLEMSYDIMIDRMVCSRSGVDFKQYRAGRLPEVQASYAQRALGDLLEAPLYIDASPDQTLAEVYAKSHRLKMQGALDLILVDYLQIMKPAITGNKSETRQEKVSALSGGLKALAKRLNVPIVVLAQLSRALMSRADKKPVLSDLRESGSIEQDADVVVLIHREEMFTPSEEEHRGKAELIIAKQRQGPLGNIEMQYQGASVRFKEAVLQ